MPLYEYKCKKCGEIFEVVQKVNDPPLKVCIKCGGPVSKMLSSPAIQFKGSGWYITDYARSNNQDQNKEKKPEKEIKRGGDNKKTESKELPNTSKS